MLAKIYGKSDIYNFKIEIFNEINNFDFLKVYHNIHGDVLTQVFNIERNYDKLIGYCKVIGYRENGVLRNIKTPFQNDAKIEKANKEFIKEVIGLNNKDGGFIGVLDEDFDLKIKLDLKRLITKHIAVLAKSGAGKSYAVGVLLEEIIEKNIPIIILDPHNEYSTIKFPNTNAKDIERLKLFNLEPKGYIDCVREFSPDTEINPQCEKIMLNINKLSPQDFINSLPSKLTPAQISLIYEMINSYNNKIDIDELIFTLSSEEGANKWGLINALESFKKLKVYSSEFTDLNEIVKYKQATIISLKGVNPELQEIFVAGLLRDLFESRKKEEIPPFFLVLEEAHNFCPERSFGEVKSSKIVRTIASEGRKFGIGLCVITQRPARIDKNVLSQCSTQLILKVTNPNDLKAVISSCEGVDSSSEMEIQRLNIGTALLTGIVDIPLKISIRPRKSKHGGETVDITLDYDKLLLEKRKDNKINNKELGKKEDIFGDSSEKKRDVFAVDNDIKRGTKKKKEFFQIAGVEISKEDAKVLLDAKELKTILIPALNIKIKKDMKEVNLLIEKITGKIVKKVFPFEGIELPLSLLELSENELRVVKEILKLKENFNPAEILLNSNLMYNEIIRICDALGKRGILKKKENFYNSERLNFVKEIDNFNYYGQIKFEEIEYDEILESKIDSEKIKNLFNLFSEVISEKEVYILGYQK